ncbi:unnamed protein product [Zymoseptoria tritici ST99CH_1E4]|uniref:U-box domain-containing protein n=1 Tax=Zymoseptoria tritici ST99CH_1E4 TaxID=1276532 RepID=A0A2H1H5R6_ZYMTR|nr:unnamed protein product [Zymoseptoria tritici ST99CH_1E4]
MDSTQSDADKIRAKRLAKLGGQNSTTATTPSSSNDVTRTSTPTPQTTDGAGDKAQTPSLRQEQPSTPAPTERKPVKINVSKPRPASPKRERPRPTEKPAESIDTWQDKTLRQVFRVTLKVEEVKDIHGNNLIFLPSTRDDLTEQNRPELLNVDVLEGAITEAAGQAPGGNIFEYLLTCFKRVSRTIRSARAEDTAKLEILKETRRLCMSYCVFAVTMPEMFGENVAVTNALVDHLLADPESDLGICTDFLTQASALLEEDESIKEAIVNAAEELSRRLAHLDMLGDYTMYVRAMRNILRFPKIVDAVTQSPMWAPPDVEAQNIETSTILGPFFRLSPMQQNVANSYFSAPRTRDRGFIANGQNAIRMTLRTLQDELFTMADTVVRASPATRERILNWFALCVNKNHKKRAMRVDYRTVSGDGFLVNVTNALDRLSEPFMDASFSKIEKIDVDYLRRDPRVDISDETKINADQKASDEFYSHKADGKSNFISEVFFLTVAAHHYGTEAAQTRMTTMRKSVKRAEKDQEQFEAERHKYINDPRYLARYEEQLKKIKQSIDNSWSTIHATYGVLMDDVTQSRSMHFMRYVIVWLLRLASRQNLPKEKLQLPLPAEQPEVFKCLPEYFLEDIVENFKFITQEIPKILTPQQCDEIVQMCVTFLRNSEYVKNPGVKSGLVTILYYGIMPYGNSSRGVLGDLLIGSAFANKHLLHALMKFYIEAESTGTHTQFFDKFNIRYEIFQVIKRIWVNTQYRENLAKEARVNTNFFVQFVNMLVNDATFVLDESLSSFIKIHDLSKEMKDAAYLQGLSEEERKAKQEMLEDHKSRAKSYMGLTRETMETLILFTETLAESFTMKEIVTRLADMLDYNLALMVGPKSSNLKVENPTEYGFNPKALLSDIISVYTNLAAKQNFIEAIARDARSYSKENFAKATEIMTTRALKSPDELRIWQKLGSDAAEAKAMDDQEEEDLGDIPDDFLDPLLATLMTDPVILPVSKETIDRATIRSHLLSDPTDPFNRAPLKIEEVVDNVELREKIEAWKRDQKAARAAERMDTSDG